MIVDRWVRDRDTGRLVVFQAPNPALWVFLAAYVLRRFTDGALEDKVSYVGMGALIVWGLDELVRGAAPIRRLFGAVVLGWELWRLLGA